MTQSDTCEVNMKPGWICIRGFHETGPCALVENPPVLCATCRNPHDNHPFKHPFNDGSLSTMDAFTVGHGHQPPSVRRIPGPCDPVLRQALVDKGILSPDDLRAAEEKIQAITGQVMRGGMS